MGMGEAMARVRAELESLPRGDEPQNQLRMAYRALRLKTLGPKGDPARTAADDLHAAQAEVRRAFPAAAFVVLAGFPG